MKKIQLLVFIVYLCLCGCTHVAQELGVSDLEWASYSQDKQQRLLTNYEQIAKERAKAIKKPEEQKNLSDSSLTVKIYAGKVMFPPAFINWQTYQPACFTIAKNECRNIELVQTADNNYKTTLGACFYNNVLYLDPSNYDLTKKLGSTRIYFSPLWLPGFTYAGVSSSGYVRLNNVTIEIKQEKLELE